MEYFGEQDRLGSHRAYVSAGRDLMTTATLLIFRVRSAWVHEMGACSPITLLQQPPLIHSEWWDPLKG